MIALAPQLTTQLLEASTEDEIDDAFEVLFDIVHDARDSGWLVQLQLLFKWATENASALNHEVSRNARRWVY